MGQDLASRTLATAALRTDPLIPKVEGVYCRA